MAVVMVNKQGNLDWWNFAAEKLLVLQHPKDRNPSFAEYFHSIRNVCWKLAERQRLIVMIGPKKELHSSLASLVVRNREQHVRTGKEQTIETSGSQYCRC